MLLCILAIETVAKIRNCKYGFLGGMQDDRKN